MLLTTQGSVFSVEDNNFRLRHPEFPKVVNMNSQEFLVLKREKKFHGFSDSTCCFGTGPVSEASQKTTSRWKDHLDSWNGKVQYIDGNNYNFEFCVFTQQLTPRKTVRMSRCMSFAFQEKDGKICKSEALPYRIIFLSQLILFLAPMKSELPQ